MKKEPLDEQTVLTAEAKTELPLKTSELNEMLQTQPEAQQDAVVEEAPEGKGKVTPEVKGTEQKYLQKQEPEGEVSEEEVSALMELIGDVAVETGLEAPDAAKAQEDGDGD